jgi:dUTP pyrophosphatase
VTQDKEHGSSAVTLQFKRLPHGDGLPAPAYHSSQAAGLDLPAAVSADGPLTLAPGDRALIPTGFAMAIPEGFQAEVRPRSGLALKHGVTVLNSPGTIDADYRGEIMVLLINHGRETFLIERGSRIAQLLITPVVRATVEVTAHLSESARGDGGFGSTG